MDKQGVLTRTATQSVGTAIQRTNNHDFNYFASGWVTNPSPELRGCELSGREGKVLWIEQEMKPVKSILETGTMSQFTAFIDDVLA